METENKTQRAEINILQAQISKTADLQARIEAIESSLFKVKPPESKTSED